MKLIAVKRTPRARRRTAAAWRSLHARIDAMWPALTAGLAARQTGAPATAGDSCVATEQSPRRRQPRCWDPT